MIKQYQTWLIASNPSTYDIENAFSQYDSITWGLTISVNVGDIIYIYVAAPRSKIMYKTIVEKVDVPVSERLGAEFWVTDFKPNRKLVNLRFISELSDDRLKLNKLQESGLMTNAPQGPRHVSDKLEGLLSNI